MLFMRARTQGALSFCELFFGQAKKSHPRHSAEDATAIRAGSESEARTKAGLVLVCDYASDAIREKRSLHPTN
jgi:hypothetical protein